MDKSPSIILNWLFLIICSIVLPVNGQLYCNTDPEINKDPDFDRNGIVNYLDLEQIAKNWLWSGQTGNNATDLNIDGIVDFNDFSMFAKQWLSRKNSVAIFIDPNSYTYLHDEIELLKSDIENDLKVRVFIFPDNWSDIESIKDILREKHSQDGLLGALLIGEIPTAYFEYQNSGATPSDWYFQDLSDKFIDSDKDGKFEREYYFSETDITMRDIWTGRIKPPLGRLEGIEMLRDYLNRNHKYRTGTLKYNRNMLYFGSVAINQNGISEQDYFNLVNEIDDYTGFYESDANITAIYDPDLQTQKNQYLSLLPNNYDFVFVNIHGSTMTQWLGGSTSVYYNEIIKAKPEALFSVLASCTNGNFTQENYFAGWFLFSGNSLIVTGNTVPAMLVGATSVDFLYDYIPLNLGVTFGEMYKNDRSFLVSHVFGDPTLTMRPKPSGELPKLCLNKTELDFEDTERGTKIAKSILFENTGTNSLEVNFKKACFSINSEYENPGYWDVFYYKHPETGSLFRNFVIPANESKYVPFIFYPREDGPLGKYSMIMLFQTNDPENPYLEISLTGNAIEASPHTF